MNPTTIERGQSRVVLEWTLEARAPGDVHKVLRATIQGAASPFNAAGHEVKRVLQNGDTILRGAVIKRLAEEFRIFDADLPALDGKAPEPAPTPAAIAEAEQQAAEKAAQQKARDDQAAKDAAEEAAEAQRQADAKAAEAQRLADLAAGGGDPALQAAEAKGA